MKTKLMACILILTGIVACAHMGGMEEKEKIYGKNPPVIGQSFASETLDPGDDWKIYLKASDPDGDMDTIIAVVSQPGVGNHPVSMGRIKGENAKELSGYVYVDTSVPSGVNFLNNQELTITLEIKDKAGHSSKAITHRVHILEGQTQKSPPAGAFKEKALGPIMVTFVPPGGRR